MKKISIKPELKQRIREIDNSVDQVRKEISLRIQKEYTETVKAFSNEREDLFQEQLNFIKSISEMFRNDIIKVGTKIKVTTQTGPNGGDVLTDYEGTVEHIYDKYKPCFDLSDKNYYEGRKFTIGSSCIQSIEVCQK